MTPALRAILHEECARAAVRPAEVIGRGKRRGPVTAVRWEILARAWCELRPRKPRVYTMSALAAAMSLDHSSVHYALAKKGVLAAPASEATPHPAPPEQSPGFAEARARPRARSVSEDRPSGREGGQAK